MIQFLLIPKYTIELTYVIKPVLYGVGTGWLGVTVIDESWHEHVAELEK